MKKKMNLPLFNIESIINENIFKNIKGNNSIKTLNNLIQPLITQSTYEKGYKEIMKKKYELKHSSILSTTNYTNSNNNFNNLNNKNNNQHKYILISQSNNSGGYKDNLNLNNYTTNKRKKINKKKSSKLIKINQTFSEFSLFEDINRNIMQKKKINEQSPNNNYNIKKNKNILLNENSITINNLDSNSSMNKNSHKRNIKEKKMIYDDPIKTINKIYSYINTSNANKKKSGKNKKKIFYNIFNSKFFEDNKKTIITDRYLNNNKQRSNKNLLLNNNMNDINSTFNSINIIKSKTKSKSKSKEKRRIIKDNYSNNKSNLNNNIQKLKNSISFYNNIGKIDNKLFLNKIRRKNNNKAKSTLKWNYNKSIDYKSNSSNVKKNKSNISNKSNSRNDKKNNNDSNIIKRNKTLNINNLNLNNKIYKRQKSDIQFFKSDFNIKKMKKYNKNSINIKDNIAKMDKTKNKNNTYTDNKSNNKNYKKEKNHKNYIDFVKYCKNSLNEEQKFIKMKKSKNLLVPPLNLNNDFKRDLKIGKIRGSNFIHNKFKSTDYTSESKSKSKSKRIETDDKNRNKINSFIIKKKRNYIFYNNYIKNSNKSSASHFFDSSFLFKNKNFDININHNHSALNIMKAKKTNKSLNNSSIINIINPINNNSNYMLNNFHNFSLIKNLNNSMYSLRENKKSNSFSKKIEMNKNYDDKEGNYIIKRNELILKRYEIINVLGKGSFGICCKCYDKKKNEYACIKILKNSQNSNELAKSEINILKELNSEIVKKSGHIIRMKNYFSYRGHICIVFELLSNNLYEEIQNSNYVGFDLSTILKFSIQILFGLLILKNKKIIHCDLKPENILLIKKGKTGIKIIDFGSSCYTDQSQYEYIQSRYYRAPEILLGLNYGCEIDMWSLGCILCELYCGIPIFPGENEYDMIYYIMEYIGLPPKDLIEKSPKKLDFFNEDGKPLEKKNSLGKIRKPNKKSIEAFLINADKDFIDLIKNILKWKKEERFSPEDALKHKWIIKNLTKEGSNLHYLKLKEYSLIKRDNKENFNDND